MGDEGDSEGELPAPEPFSIALRWSDGTCGIAFGDDEAERDLEAFEEAGCEPDDPDCSILPAPHPARSVVAATTVNETRHYGAWNATSECADLESRTLDQCNEGRHEDLPSCTIACRATLPGC